MDLVISMPKIPAIGETVLGGKSSMVFGGKGANQAVAAIRSGGDISFIAKVGNDLFGRDMIKHFQNEGFSTDLILTDNNEPTGVAQIFVSEKGENSIAVAPGANMSLTSNDIDLFENLIAKSRVVLAQLETPIETIEHIANVAFKHNVKLILNPAPAQMLSDELLQKTWLITPNETEASLLTGVEVINEITAKKAAVLLFQKGVKNVIITLGERGSLLFNNNGSKHFDAFKVDALDTTAAGDVFNGTLAVAVSENKSIEESINFSAAAAAISVTRNGAQPSIPKLEEVEVFLNKFKKI